MALILLIEDDPQISDLVQQVLQMSRHEVAAQPTADSIPGHGVDLVVTDLFGDPLGDDAVLDHIDQIRRSLGATPIVVCSGRDRLPLERLALLGVVDVIAKPFDVMDFLDRVNTALG